jgi:hypothetical protein
VREKLNASIQKSRVTLNPADKKLRKPKREAMDGEEANPNDEGGEEYEMEGMDEMGMDAESPSTRQPTKDWVQTTNSDSKLP